MKTELRNKILKKRNSLEKSEILEKSKKIMENLFSLPEYKKAKNVMFFVSFNNEVHTHEMIKEALKNKIVVVPKVIENKIEPALITDFDRLVPTGKFNILEPFDHVLFNKKNIDVVIVAGTVFDKKGHRIGYGYSYYDSFLITMPKALKIALAFDFQIIEDVPNDEHDVPVDMIVTEKEIVSCFDDRK